MSKGGIDKLTRQELIMHMKEALKTVYFKGLTMRKAFRNIDIISSRGTRSEGMNQLMHLIQVFNIEEYYEGTFRYSFNKLTEREQEKF